MTTSLPAGATWTGDGMDTLTLDVTDLADREAVLDQLPQYASVWVLRLSGRVYIEWANCYSPESVVEILNDLLWDMAN